MKQYKANDQMAALFVDLQTAYNTVYRKYCFQLSEKKKSLMIQNLFFYKTLLQQLCENNK